MDQRGVGGGNGEGGGEVSVGAGERGALERSSVNITFLRLSPKLNPPDQYQP